MSRINGEKARASIAKKNRTARREKDRARLAEIRQAAGAPKTDDAKGDDKSKTAR